MKILYAASEAAPYAKSGGLADVAGALPKALVRDGIDCRVIMPLYGDLKFKDTLTYVTNFSVPVGWRSQYCGLFKAEHDGVTFYFIDNEYYFKRSGLYGFYDDGERFAFFSRAILETLFYTDFAEANVVAAAISIPIVIVGFVLSCTFRRYTPEGAELAARCKALKHWLEDFTRLKEAIPGDLVLWNKLLVMGVALGVSKEVLRQLAEAVPADLRNSDDFYDNYPCYWWYYHHYGNESPLDSFNDVYHETIRELASSSDSSSGGSGGGFSGGGGGGAGGGGGGTF